MDTNDMKSVVTSLLLIIMIFGEVLMFPNWSPGNFVDSL